MNIAITGGTGLVGQKLTNYLVEQGHTVTILTRNAANKQSKEHISYVEWLQPDATPAEHLEGTDAFINLAGESIMGRWTALKKRTHPLKSTRSNDRIDFHYKTTEKKANRFRKWFSYGLLWLF